MLLLSGAPPLCFCSVKPFGWRVAMWAPAWVPRGHGATLLEEIPAWLKGIQQLRWFSTRPGIPQLLKSGAKSLWQEVKWCWEWELPSSVGSIIWSQEGDLWGRVKGSCRVQVEFNEVVHVPTGEEC